jgi:5'(3')-deoxyribonucleotidase
MGTKGLILDIDDTLAETALTAITLMKERFGHPLSVRQILERFEQPGNVPEWQTVIARKFLFKLMNNEEFLINLPRVPNSQEVIEKLSLDYPVQFYMTSRLPKFNNLTKKWLKTNNFPNKKIIFRETLNVDKAWKLNYLIKEGKDENIFIDNELTSFDTDLEAYRGKLIWFNRFGKDSENTITSVRSWDSICNYIKNLPSAEIH